MSSSDAMFEASSVYSQYVNEQIVKIDSVPSLSTWAVVNLLFLLLSDGFRLLGFNERKLYGFGSMKSFFLYFCKIFVPKSEGPPVTHEKEAE